MITAEDLDYPTGETCKLCGGKAEVSIAGVDMCATDASREWPDWRQYLAPRPTSQLPEGMGRANSAAELGM